MKPTGRLAAVLMAAGAVLKRDKKHRVYELPNGRVVTIANTPSDHRATLNAERDVKAAAGVMAWPERRKASAEVRAERRQRPGRNGERSRLASLGTMAGALEQSGVVEKQLRIEIALLQEEARMRERGMWALTDAIDQQAARIRELESLRVVRLQRWVTQVWQRRRGW